MRKKPNVSYRVPITMEDFLNAQDSGVPGLLIWAVIIGVGSLDEVVQRRLILFLDPNLLDHFRGLLPASMGGCLTRRQGRENIKLMKKLVSKHLGDDFLNRFRKDLVGYEPKSYEDDPQP